MQQGNHQLSEGSLAVLRDFRLQDGQVLGNVGANRDITVQSSPKASTSVLIPRA